MPNFNFKDRPDDARLRITQAQYPDTNITTVQTFLSLQYAYRTIQSQYEAALSEFDLSESRFILLMFLYRAEDGLTVSDLAQKLGVTKATTSKLLRAMTTAELVEKRPDAQDKRAVKIHLTAAGTKRLTAFLPVNFQTVNRLLGNLSESEQQELEQLLNKMIAPASGEKD